MEAYDKLYLNQNRKITEYLFHLFMEGPYDFFAIVKRYMEESPVRKGMDEGNWSALNKGINQVYHSVRTEGLPESDNQYMDGILSSWIADIYVYMQWKYGMYSAGIVSVLPPELLCKLYNPLHEASIQVACRKLYHKYFGGDSEK